MEGNQMKMREALLAIKEVAVRDMRHHVSMSESDQVSIRAWSNLFVSLVDSALAATPRNCDLPNTTERYNEFCYDHRTMETCCSGCPYEEDSDCEAQWLLSPAEKGGSE